MTRFGNALQQLRKASGMTQAELARQLEVSVSAIGMYEQGRRVPHQDLIDKAARQFNVDPEVFADHESSEEKKSRLEEARRKLFDAEFVTKYSNIDEDGRAAVKAVLTAEYKRCIRVKPEEKYQTMRYRPINLMDLPVSAGTGISLLSEARADPIYVTLDSVSKNADFVLEVRGDSMEPKFHNKDLILVRKADVVEPGEIGIFELNGEGYFKKLGDHELISLNKRYPPIEIHADDDVRCFGRVLGRTSRVYPTD